VQLDFRIKYSLLGVIGAVGLAMVGSGFNACAYVSKPAEQEPAAAAVPAVVSTAEASGEKEDRININTESPAVVPAPATPSQDFAPSATGEKPGEKGTPVVVVTYSWQPDRLYPCRLETARLQENIPPRETSVESVAIPETEQALEPSEPKTQAPPTAGAQTASQVKAGAAAIEPEFVRALIDIAAGNNDSNPFWSPSGEMIAFERSQGDKREILVARQDGSVIQKIYCRSSNGDGEMDFFFPGIVEDVSYNSGITWSPDESRLVFMSNGGSGNYDLYLLPALGQEKTIRLTENPEKDSHPHWSPAGEQLVFVSGRSGKAEIYLMDLKSRKLSDLTKGKKTYLYPQWSPDGRKIVMLYGSNENHDIYLIADIKRPFKTIKPLIRWEHDDLRPMWSPDGQKIAFYTNYNLQNDPKIWSIIVIASDGSDPDQGEGLAAKVVARNVIPDIERGPAWMPDSQRIVYVKNDKKTYNPIYVVHIGDKTDQPIKTETKMNHDVVASKNGTLAFRAQTDQWDHIYIARLKN
jgi:Tol biopolymer transport system component